MDFKEKSLMTDRKCNVCPRCCNIAESFILSRYQLCQDVPEISDIVEDFHGFNKLAFFFPPDSLVAKAFCEYLFLKAPCSCVVIYYIIPMQNCNIHR